MGASCISKSKSSSVLRFCRSYALTKASDEPELHLASAQRQVFAGWKRPHELLSKNVIGETKRITDPVMSVSGKIDLVQDMLTDCSVVASLCATTARSERGPDKVT